MYILRVRSMLRGRKEKEEKKRGERIGEMEGGKERVNEDCTRGV